jgi:hypothetical protein
MLAFWRSFEHETELTNQSPGICSLLPAHGFFERLIAYSQARDEVQLKIQAVKTHKLLQVCKQVVTNLFTSCRQVVFALLVPSCCNKFGTSC